MNIEAKIKLSRQITQMSFFLLLLTLTLNLWLQNAPWVIYTAVLLPLLPLTLGIIKNRLRTLIWVGFILLLYFAIAAYKVSVPEPSYMNITELLLIVMLFCAATVNARLRQKHSDKTTPST